MTRPLLHLAAGCLAAGVLTGCADSTAPRYRTPTNPGVAAAKLPQPGARGLTVMTRNVQFGGDLTGLLGPSATLPDRVATFWQDVLNSNFPERAGAFARDIETYRPALIGLQEMALFRTQDPSDAISGGTTPATDVALDYLDILLDSLAARGLSYHVATAQVLTDMELPATVSTSPPQYIDVRYTDRDVILARDDVPTGMPLGAPYAARLSVTIGIHNLTLLRGWISVEATYAGITWRFATTHLESGSSSGLATLNQLQAQELIGVLHDEDLPTILVCDCNSRADGTGTSSYGWLVDPLDAGGGGFLDAWLEANPRDDGFTARVGGNLNERLDLILVRQGFHAAPAAGIVGGVQATVVGKEVQDQTPSGLWPSDHAGVVAILRLP